MSAQSNGLVAAAQQNEAGGSTPKNFSRFPLSYSFYNTERFGEYMPCFVQEAVSTDTLPLNSSHEVRSYTLTAPLMQSLLKKKDFFYVPMEAILPLNWNKFYTNPVIGEDVPDDVGCGVANFWDKVGSLYNNSFTALSGLFADESELTVNVVAAVFKFLVFFEYFYSTGSLMESLGISGHDYIIGLKLTPTNNEDCTFDDFFDAVVSIFVANDLSFYVKIDDVFYTVTEHPASSGLNSENSLSYREFLERLRDGIATFSVSAVYGTQASRAAVYDALGRTMAMSGYSETAEYPGYFFNAIDDSHVPLNLSRLWAYQLVCAHFYTNDHVDFVYSAELFRQYIQELCTRTVRNTGASSIMTSSEFSVNGLTYRYDALSARCFFDVLLAFDSSIFTFRSISGVGAQSRPETLSDAFAYFTALLHYKRSLRYMDYFTGARTRPLAVGDASVDVADSKVDVLDLSRSRMMAKFLQAVNRSGRKFGSYMKELFGKVPSPDYHNPFYLAHTSDVVGSNETQNTADGQRAANAITSNLMTNASRYMFEFHPDRDCVVIGITYYDIPRVYTRATERQNFFLDRFDMFNPYLQFIGDQPIYQAEIGTLTPNVDTETPFGYQNRHMEYKQRYNQAAGAFANPSTNLQDWLFVADLLQRKRLKNITSGFIRSYNSELDHFFTSLTGYSNGSYFHFIVRYDNRQDATRPMAYAPVIA